MSDFQIGDVVTRKSYGSDVYFAVTDIISTGRAKPVFVLRGLLHRIEADSGEDDLVKKNSRNAYLSAQRYFSNVRQSVNRRSNLNNLLLLSRFNAKPGKILHIDSSRDFLDMCMKQYKEARLEPVGILAPESQQPGIVRNLLEQNRPDILVVTGHDGIKKGNEKRDSVESYRTSKYFIQSVNIARKYQPDKDRLSIFAGACQSYYEAIIDEGANFASSPGRILINALDPSIIAKKIALTDSRKTIFPREAIRLTVSGEKGIGGVNTKGHLTWV